MGKATISMAIFNSYVCLPEGIGTKWNDSPMELLFLYPRTAGAASWPSHRSAADNEAMQGAVEPAEPAAATVER